MQYLDDHMDDLFQKAAEKYPLKTNVDDFDKLLPLIAATPIAGKAVSGPMFSRKFRGLLILLFIMAGSVASYFIFNPSQKVPHNKQAATRQKTISPQAKNNSEQLPATMVSAPQEAKPVGMANKTFLSAMTSTTKTNYISTKKEAVQPFPFINAEKNHTDFSMPEHFSFLDQRAFKNIFENKNSTTELNLSPKASTIITSLKNKRGLKKTFFYYGVKAGLAWNQIKHQGVTQAGFNGGFLLGLQINRQLSVETGIEITQKKYYTHGKYFNPKTGAMPPNMEVMSLNGTSNLIEIPLQVKFNFSKTNNTVYGIGGLSTYIMTKEANQYKARVSGQVEHINSTYNDAKTYTAAEINLGIGYQRKLSKKINIRIEPYIQIPVKGIGVGALPVTSTGVHLVLSKK